MTIKPNEFEMLKLAHLQASGLDKKKYALVKAVYDDSTETAKKLIESDPDQITAKDPFAGLTPLHIAIFRQNRELVELIAPHPKCNLFAKDNFGRTPVDMLDYTTDQTIFRAVMDNAYPDEADELEEIAREYAAMGNVVPLKPENP